MDFITSGLSSPTALIWIALSALLAGFAKSSIGGLGILIVPMMAMAFPARESTGALLPMLIMADVFAVFYYRRDADTKILLRIFPVAAMGVVIGWQLMDVIPKQYFSKMMVWIILSLMVFELIQKKWNIITYRGWGYRLFFGLLAGITTMLANAAGPLFAVYLLTLGLKKDTFVGTRSVFFLLINVWKLPFSASLGLITVHSLALNMMCLPVVVIGAWLGKSFLQKINLKVFEWMIRAAAAVSAIPFLWK